MPKNQSIAQTWMFQEDHIVSGVITERLPAHYGHRLMRPHKQITAFGSLRGVDRQGIGNTYGLFTYLIVWFSVVI